MTVASRSGMRIGNTFNYRDTNRPPSLAATWCRAHIPFPNGGSLGGMLCSEVCALAAELGAWCRCLRFLFRKGDPSGGRFGPRYARSSLRLGGAWCRCSRCLFRMEGLSAECSGSRFARSRLRKTQRQMPQPKETSSRSSPRSFACTGLGHAWPEPAFLPLFKPIDPSDLLRFISTPGNAEADT